MSNSGKPNLLQLKVKSRLTSLEDERNEVVKAVGYIGGKVTQAVESAKESYNGLECCSDVDIKNIYQKVSQELEAMDEEITIIRATVFINELALEEDLVEDHWQTKSNLSTSSNYLLRKLARKVTSMEKEGVTVTKSLTKLKYDVEKFVENAKEAAKLLLSVTNNEEKTLHKVYKEVNRTLGSIEMEITMVRARVSSWVESLAENVLKEEVQKEVLDEDSEGKDQVEDISELKKTEVVTEVSSKIDGLIIELSMGDESECTPQVKEICGFKEALVDTEVSIANIGGVKKYGDVVEIVGRGEVGAYSEQKLTEVKSDGDCLDENVTNAVVEKLLTKKMQENPKLRSICQSSVENRALVTNRLKDSLLKSGRIGSSKSCFSDKRASSAKVRDTKLPISTNKANETAKSIATASMIGYATPTSIVVETHRRQQLDQVRKKFGEYGEPLMVGEYKDFKMTFDSGLPAMFWLHVATDAMHDFQSTIQRKMKGKPAGDGGGAELSVGSLVLARYSVDKTVYRAKVEEVMEGEERLVSVRYIDYGNRDDNLPPTELYTWDTMLENIPPQAVPCCFYKAPAAVKEKTSLTLEEMHEFTLLMKQSSPMQMYVHERLSIPLDVFSPTSQQLGPELSVSLRGKDGRDILTKLSHLPTFSCYFGTQQVCNLAGSCSSISVAPSLSRPDTLTQTNIRKLEALFPPAKQRPAPLPLHLDSEDTVELLYDGDGPPSPVHPNIASRAVEKVQWWMEREEHGNKQRNENLERRKKEQASPKFQEPDFVKSESMKTKAALLSQARKALSPEEHTDVSPPTPMATKAPNKIHKLGGDFFPVKADKAKPDLSCPSLDMGTGMIVSETQLAETVPVPYTPPSLAMQDVEVDVNGEFQLLVSHLVSPDELYVHPVQETSGNLARLEEELQIKAVGEEVARELEVVVGSVWAVHQQEWFRVIVNSVENGRVTLQALDYGHYLLAIGVDQLHRLPAGLPSSLPGLAVRCHMVNVRPVQEGGWDKLALQVLTHCLQGEGQYTALLVERKESSLGLAIIVEDQGMFNTVNQKLVKMGCAVSSMFGSQDDSDEKEDSGMVNDWDPMAEDFNSSTNKHVTNDDYREKRELGLASHLHVPG